MECLHRYIRFNFETEKMECVQCQKVVPSIVVKDEDLFIITIPPTLYYPI